MASNANIVVNDLGMGGRGNFWTMAYSANIMVDDLGMSIKVTSGQWCPVQILW